MISSDFRILDGYPVVLRVMFVRLLLSLLHNHLVFFPDAPLVARSQVWWFACPSSAWVSSPSCAANHHCCCRSYAPHSFRFRGLFRIPHSTIYLGEGYVTKTKTLHNLQWDEVMAYSVLATLLVIMALRTFECLYFCFSLDFKEWCSADALFCYHPPLIWCPFPIVVFLLCRQDHAISSQVSISRKVSITNHFHQNTKWG